MSNARPDPVLDKRYGRAVAFAVKLHARQARKDTRIPYLTHLLAVSSLVLEDGGTTSQAIAGLLHDGPEDQGGVGIPQSRNLPSFQALLESMLAS